MCCVGLFFFVLRAVSCENSLLVVGIWLNVVCVMMGVACCVCVCIVLTFSLLYVRSLLWRAPMCVLCVVCDVCVCCVSCVCR